MDQLSFLNGLDEYEILFVSNLENRFHNIFFENIAKLSPYDCSNYLRYLMNNMSYLDEEYFRYDEERVYGWHAPKCTCGMEKIGYSLRDNPEAHSSWCDGLKKEENIIFLTEEII